MSYTLEQKREALAKGELWWRFPISKFEENKQWSRPHIQYITNPAAIYFIGSTPPRVLSELEGELLEALKWMHQHVLELCLTHNHPLPQASLDRSTAAIQKAESTP